MKLFLAIFAATLLFGPAFAVAVFLSSNLLLTSLVSALGGDGFVLASLAVARESPGLLLYLAYMLGGAPAALGGSYLGWRFTRSPPQLGPGPPLLAGLVLGAALAAIMTLPQTGFATPGVLLFICVVSVACAAACWAIARLIYRLTVRSPR